VKWFVFSFFLLSSSALLASENSSSAYDDETMAYLQEAADYYWGLDNYEGAAMLYYEIERERPAFAATFNLSLALFNLGEYKEAMSKLVWVQEHYALDVDQRGRVDQLSGSIEHRYQEYHGVGIANLQSTICQTRNKSCLLGNALSVEPLSFVATAPHYVESEVLMFEHRQQAAQPLSRKLEYKLVM